MSPPELTRPDYLTGADRERYAAYVDHLYVTDGMTIRQIARHTGRGYATIHALLTDHGTIKRPEGRAMGTAVHPRRPGTEEVIEVLERKTNGKWGKIRD